MVEQIRTILKDKFGFAEFRPLQEEIINDILTGGNRFVVLPTGGGKTLAYLLPAFIWPGLTLVVSPLISLMEDQLKRAEALGLRAAICSNATCFKDLQVVFVSPEKLFSRNIITQLGKSRVDHLVIDEVHSVSVWGSSFRPFYGLLKEIVNLVRPQAISLFSATVGKELKLEIEEKLGLQNVRNFKGGFDRENISFHQIDCRSSEVFLAQLLKKIRGKTIVYCGTRKKVEFVSLFLLQYGFRVSLYHAGLEREKRVDLQRGFKRGEVSIFCVTSAFGMGVDIPDIRTVIHLQAPSNLENYYQEVGRAGRDGKKALALLLLKQGGDKLQQAEPLAKFIFLRQSLLPKKALNESDFLNKLGDLATGLYEVKGLYAFLLYYEVYVRTLEQSEVIVQPTISWQSKLKAAYSIEMKKKSVAKLWVKKFLKKKRCKRLILLRFFQENIKHCSGCDHCGSEYSAILQKIKRDTNKVINVLSKLKEYPLYEQRKIITQSRILAKEKIVLERAQRFLRKIDL